ncbi:MAG: leucine-rich repeat protein, partial [Clostridia bacterium]|nr:leucine-rich repeat protein [Clostridia bacterium]
CESLTNLTIPDSVTSIGDSAFSDCISLTSITIPDSVTRIGRWVFDRSAIYNDKSNWKDGVLYIGDCLIEADSSVDGSYTVIEGTRIIADCAFYRCGSLLTSVTIPDTVRYIGNWTFNYCDSLSSVELSESLVCLGDGVFYGCKSLTSVTLPASLTSIGDETFDYCTSLESINADDDNSVFKSVDGVLYDKEVKVLVLCPEAKTKVDIPDSVTAFGRASFFNCRSMTSIEIPESVTVISGSGLGWIPGRPQAHFIEGFTIYGHDNTEAERYANENSFIFVILGEAHVHAYTDVVTAPTCTEQGYTTHTCECGDSYVDTYMYALGHVPAEAVRENEKAATCTEAGSYDEVVYCSVCKSELSREAKTTDALGHEFGDWAVKTAPTCTAKGTEERICARCEAIESRETDALGHDFGTDGNAEKCAVCGEKNPDYKPPVEFKDVKEDAYYAEPVAWAVAKNITAGTSATTFSPDEGCTRGQVVTFLWRAAGQPEPSGAKNPFKDVKESDYFYKAVLWAVENEVTAGTRANTFSPGDVCTRGQIVTFLWRANGKPTPTETKNPFKDVKTTDYFYNAVLWAVEKGITLGTDATHFSPGDTCTRGQVVTFLYRDMA